MINIDTAKSYATEENLMKALKEVSLADKRPLVVRNREGRWTAVFGYSLSQHQNPAGIARLGFVVIN